MSRLLRKRAEYAEIPQDLLLEIMSWLPGKSMVRFNSVSKQCTYSLTVTAFLLRHSRSPAAFPDLYHAFCCSDPKPFSDWPTLKLFCFEVHHDEIISNDKDYDSYTSPLMPIVKMIPVPLPALPEGVFVSSLINVSNFCDGLVCVFNWRDTSHKLPVLLCSSRIIDYSALPSTSLCLPPPKFPGYHWCLLGFDPTRGEYRILRSINIGDRGTRGKYTNNIEYEILSIGSKSWKHIDDANVPPSIRIQGNKDPRGFCLNGVIYWLHKNDNHDVVLASIVLASEEFRALCLNQLNGLSCDISMSYYLAPLNGHLTLFVSDWKLKMVWQWTFSDHQDPNPVCYRRIVFPSPFHTDRNSDFPAIISGRNSNFPAIISGTVIRRRLSYTKYFCYDVEKGVSWVIDTKLGWRVLNIG